MSLSPNFQPVSLYNHETILRYAHQTRQKKIFTDGSKDGNRVASAACCRGYTESESMPGPASVYIAEINALLIGIEMMENSNKKRLLVVSDFLSYMHALSNGNTSNPLLTQVLEEFTSLVSL